MPLFQNLKNSQQYHHVVYKGKQTAQAKEVYCVQLVEMIKWCSQYELSLFLPLYIGVDLRRERKERLSLLRSLLGPTLT